MTLTFIQGHSYLTLRNQKLPHSQKILAQAGFKPGTFCSRGGRLTTRPTRRSPGLGPRASPLKTDPFTTRLLRWSHCTSQLTRTLVIDWQSLGRLLDDRVSSCNCMYTNMYTVNSWIQAAICLFLEAPLWLINQNFYWFFSRHEKMLIYQYFVMSPHVSTIPFTCHL